MKTLVEQRQERWVVIVNGTPHSHYSNKTEADTAANKLADKVPVAKMTWDDYKKSQGIDNIREDEDNV